MKMTHISVALITMASFCQAAPQEQPIVSVSSRANPKATWYTRRPTLPIPVIG